MLASRYQILDDEYNTHAVAPVEIVCDKARFDQQGREAVDVLYELNRRLTGGCPLGPCDQIIVFNLDPEDA